MTTRVERPVTSSICLATVVPSSTVGELLARADLVAGGGEQHGAVRHLVALALAAVVVHDHHLAGTADDDFVALGVAQVAHGGGETHRARRLGLDGVLHRGPGSRAADVERAHRQLRARLADGLGRNDADGLAHVDRRAAAQIAPVALGAHAPARVA
jgi:hypothetical protein